MVRQAEPMIQKSVRLPRSLWTRLSAHARALTEASKGAFVFSENDAIRDILTRNLAEVADEGEDDAAVKPAAKSAKKGARR